MRASTYSTPVFTATSTATLSTTHSKWVYSTPRLSAIPTEIKNSPNSSPLNGSIAVSSSWRYSLSASSTPAINVPSAIDSPSASINSAEPNTSSSVAAVNTSRTPDAAIKRNTGRSR
ncbi:hypothetical protein D3C71_1382980 [compost metagenome]